MKRTLRMAGPVLGVLAALGLLVQGAEPSSSNAWRVETVDSSGPGKYSSMRIDTDGNVHIAYIVEDGKVAPLKYAILDQPTGKWFTMKVAEFANAAALALDSKQHPHIAYNDDGGSGKLRYAFWDGTTWKKPNILLNAEIVAYEDSIVLDAQDHPAISFYEYRGPKDSGLSIRMRTISWNGSAWEARTVDSEQGSGKFNAMAMDMEGHMHLAYANVAEGSMRYAYWDGKSWNPEIIDGGSHGQYVGYSACIAVDSQGNPHVSYMDETNRSVKYAVRKNGHWQIYQLDKVTAFAYPDRQSIAIDQNGHPWVGYYDAGQGILKIAHQAEGQKWVVETVDGNASGFTSSMQIDRGTVWISYADEANGGLKVAHREIGSTAEAPAPKPLGSGKLE